MKIRKRFRHCGRYGKRSFFAQVAYYPLPYDRKEKGRVRQRKYQTTIPSKRMLNIKKAKRYLEALVHSNFGEGDLLLGLSYDNKFLPEDEKAAKKLFANFMARVNYRQKKMGKENAKWVSVIERGKNGRIHHHVIIKCDLDRDTLEKLWKYGRANTKRLQPDSQKGLLPLIDYIAKEFKDDGKPKSIRKWDCSKGNLTKPWDTVNDDPRMMSNKKFKLMEELPEDCEMMKKIIELDNPGYEFIDLEKTQREETGEYFFFARLRLSTKLSTNNTQPVENSNKKKKAKAEDAKEMDKCQKTKRKKNARKKPPPKNTGPP